MSDNWDFYASRVDDEPASIFLDMGIAQDPPRWIYDHMAYLRVEMLRPRDDGLSSQEEFDDLIALEDAVVADITASGATIYVGRNTSHGNRDLYFYTRDPAAFEAAAKAAMSVFPAYSSDSGTRADPDWHSYFGFLYPSPADRQRMSNRSVLSALADHGDRSDLPREIDHLAIFASHQAREDFAALVSGRGFTLTDRSDDDGEFRLHFIRSERPDQIDDTTVELVVAAHEQGGAYDGWGCEIET